MNTDIKGILLDIEGTTSSISFVYDEMFPYVRKHLSQFLDANWGDAEVALAISLLAEEAGAEKLDKQTAAMEVIRLMDQDIKSTALKHLQGMIWRSGFHSGELVAHLFDDVPVAIRKWKAAGLDVRIYSSGSIEAQMLFFGHSLAGNLLPMFSGHYDTTIGSKREVSSYEKIAAEFSLPPSMIVFVSDVVAELDAASSAGMQTRLSVRPGNPVQAENRYLQVKSFAEIEV